MSVKALFLFVTEHYPYATQAETFPPTASMPLQPAPPDYTLVSGLHEKPVAASLFAMAIYQSIPSLNVEQPSQAGSRPQHRSDNFHFSY
ncbi:hypothetical protein ACQR3P_16405 [Rhodococcus sp. IEGM1300]